MTERERGARERERESENGDTKKKGCVKRYFRLRGKGRK